MTTKITDIKAYMATIGAQARAASRHVGKATTAQKNTALRCIAEQINQQQTMILAANQQDMQAGQSGRLDSALLDRLELTTARVDAMVEGLKQIAALPDPVGAVTDLNYRPSGIQVGKMRVPLGVVGIIYESRPNVTADAAGLCLKSGNAAVLRGGSEALRSNQAIAQCIQAGLTQAGITEHAVQVIATSDRAAVGELITQQQYIDVIIPRGGKSLIERVSAEARVPVIKHLHGVCHVYIDEAANFEQAMAIAFNAKTQRYGTCNTMETLLVAPIIAKQVLPLLIKQYREEGVEVRGCELTLAMLNQAMLNDEGVVAATPQDWQEEYLAPIVSIRIVANIEAAIDHIHQFGSGHTDAIVTENYAHARQFVTEVDSSSVMVNVSTRFADGFEYGLGAEIGISTDKFHVRGPVGLEGLTSQKFIVYGSGQIRS